MLSDISVDVVSYPATNAKRLLGTTAEKGISPDNALSYKAARRQPGVCDDEGVCGGEESDVDAGDGGSKEEEE